MKQPASILFCWLMAAAVTPIFSAQTNVLLAITAPWRYTTNNLDGINWTAADYDDSSWPGPSNALLYIETAALLAPKSTPLPPRPGGILPFNTYYFRTTFNLSNATEVNLLTFSNLVDDGAIYYLNGVEVQRFNMPAGIVSNVTFSAGSHEASAYETFNLSGNMLTNLAEGTNVLAVEVHQQATNSSDIVFGSAVTGLRGVAATLTRGPYLQCSTTRSIVIRWRTTITTDSLIAFGTNPTALNLSVTNFSATSEHIVTVSNLAPDTQYYYAVGDSNGLFTPVDTNQFFLSHPLPSSQKTVRVWVIGDAGTKNANQAAVRDAFYNFNGTNTVHAWLQLGDNAYDTGTDAEYQVAVFDMYSALLRRSVTWPTLGNHETAQSTVYSDNYPYFSIFTLPTAGEAGGVPSATEHYYSFDLGMVHFICLDSMTADRSTNGAMAEWLRSDLSVTTNRWIIAFWHHPPYTKGSHNSDTESSLMQMRENFLPILEAGGVDLVLGGHSHSYERSYFINGHYGLSSTFTTNLIVHAGSGRETNGVGAYRKPDGLGESPIGNQGAVYAVAGSSGQISGGNLNHAAMFYSANVLGSMVLDFNENRLDALFLRENGNTNDWFTIIKEGTHPPRATDLTKLENGDLHATIRTRAYRTNILETSTNLIWWSPVTTNFSTNANYELNLPATNEPVRMFRIRRK